MKYLILTLITVLCGHAIAAEGNDKGNGGDIIRCRKDPSNNYIGEYALDYLAARMLGTTDNSFAEVISITASLDRIEKLLRTTDHLLYSTFKRFRYNFEESRLHEDKTHLETPWLSSEFGLPDINDENLSINFPPNCMKISQPSEPDLIQLVQRKKIGKQLTYLYDKQANDRLENRSALQFSMAIVHEYAWELTEDAEVIRQINILFHSKTTTPEGIYKKLQNLGIYGSNKYESLKSENYLKIKELFKHVKDHRYYDKEANRKEIIKLLAMGANPINDEVLHGEPYTILHVATEPDLIPILIDAGVDINSKEKWQTALMMRAKEGNAPAVQKLIELKADVTITNYEKQNALYYALAGGFSKGHMDAVRELVAAGLDINQLFEYKDHKYNTKTKNLITIMIESYINSKQRTLSNLIFDIDYHKEFWPAIETLLDLGAKPTDSIISLNLDLYRMGVNSWYPYQLNLLGMAIIFKNTAMAKRLVEMHAGINTELRMVYNGAHGGQTVTPLHLAMMLDSDVTEADVLIKSLLDNGANKDAHDKDWKYTPLHYAVAAKSLSRVQMLIEAKANLNIRGKDGKTPLDYAIELKLVEIEKVLRDAGTLP
jgi:ankyrin repeat protein